MVEKRIDSFILLKKLLVEDVSANESQARMHEFREGKSARLLGIIEEIPSTVIRLHGVCCARDPGFRGRKATRALVFLKEIRFGTHRADNTKDPGFQSRKAHRSIHFLEEIACRNACRKRISSRNTTFRRQFP